jgi:hypothetical protein
VLLGHDDITSITNRSDGIDVAWRCFCGQTGQTHIARHTATVGGRAGRLLV